MNEKIITYNAHHAIKVTLDFEPNEYAVICLEVMFAGRWDGIIEFPVTPDILRQLAAELESQAAILEGGKEPDHA